ncbi:TPA: hypothetical protein VJT00_001957, partial [Streptococcus pyogenes]|nr:hypothetical protein [Streptococcus pyogenes]
AIIAVSQLLARRGIIVKYLPLTSIYSMYMFALGRLLVKIFVSTLGGYKHGPKRAKRQKTDCLEYR